MKTNKFLIVMLFIAFVIAQSLCVNQNVTTITSTFISQETFRPKHKDIVRSSSCENSQTIEEIFDNKINEFTTLGCFPVCYKPSIQATYYALSILKMIYRLTSINQTKILNYLMAHYNSSTGLFSDQYSLRYQDMNVPWVYYGYTSPLEINSYAVLSLQILGHLDLIDSKKLELQNYIWSCFFDNGSTGGFVGSPYAPTLAPEYKILSADNTYFAILALNCLSLDWNDHATRRDQIVAFLKILQSTKSSSAYFGGFTNDNISSVYTLGSGMSEPNLWSAFFCIKALQNFNAHTTIRVTDFNQYLGVMYDSVKKFFKISGMPYPTNFTNLPATSIGLELGSLMGFSTMDRNGVISFVLNNRNSWGTWNQSTSIKYHELIDTFEVLRSFNNSGEIGRLSTADRDKILNAVLRYGSYNGGFSLLSNEYQDIENINAIVSACSLYDRVDDLNTGQLYATISSLYDYVSSASCYTFRSFSPCDSNYAGFRSYPIEFYSQTKQKVLSDIIYARSHEASFQALNALKELSMLDDFAASHNLTYLLNSIVSSQFLTEGYANRGGFLSSTIHASFSTEFQNSQVFAHYTYYAIRCMELIAEQLNLGPITNINFNKDLLKQYLFPRFLGSGDTVFFNPGTTTDVDTLLEYTYDAIYTLKAINNFASIDIQKIENYVEQSLDYDDLKNIYYSFKINEILDLNINFNFTATQELIQKLYASDFNGFYASTKLDLIGKEAFFWVCDIAKNDQVRVLPSYSDNVMLSTSNNVSVSLCNMVLKDFGPYVTIKLESSQVGTVTLPEIADNLFSAEIFVNLNPMNYPVVNGYIRVYDGVILLSELEISFNTSYDLIVDTTIAKEGEGYAIDTKISFVTGLDISPLYNGRVYAEIYREKSLLKTVNLTSATYLDYSEYSFLFGETEPGEYKILLYVTHDYQITPAKIGEVEISIEDPDEQAATPEEAQIETEGSILYSTPLIALMVSVGGTVTIISIKGKQKIKRSFKRKNNRHLNKNSKL